jgi:hypothetical protein
MADAGAQMQDVLTQHDQVGVNQHTSILWKYKEGHSDTLPTHQKN